MNTFQLLKSGASFRPEKIAPVAHLFSAKKKEERKQVKIEEAKETAALEAENPNIDEIDKELEQVKKQVEELEKSIKGSSKKALKQLEEMQGEFKHLKNKRREALIAMNKRYNRKVEGAANEAEVPEPIETFEKMQ